jgi:2-polyprenyl-6-methoxyphenol hydroxylase-like FAD-dependent oxidoreductase
LSSRTIPKRVFRRYDRFASRAKRFIALGDAMCSFDPAFGQGMSVCALEARALERLLADKDLSVDELVSRYFTQAAALIAAPWSMSWARPVTSERGGIRNRVKRLSRAYQRELLRAAVQSPALHLAFVRVVNLEAHPSSLLAPDLALRVLRHRIQRVLVRDTVGVRAGATG